MRPRSLGLARSGTVALALLLVLSSVLAGGGRASSAAAVASLAAAPRGAAAAAGHGTAAPPTAPIGRTVKTLVLFNNTVEPGNYLQAVEGLAPLGVAYDASDGMAWVTASASNAVAEVNPSNASGVRWFAANYTPEGIAFDGADNRLFIAEDASDNVTVLNATTGAFLGTYRVGSEPVGVAYDPGTDQVYVSNRGSGNVTVAFAGNLTVIANVSTGDAPEAVAYDPAAGAVVVAETDSNDLGFVNDTSHVVDRNVTVPGPSALQYSAASRVLYVGNATGLAILNGSTGALVGNVSGAVRPAALAYDPTYGTVYAVTVGYSGGGALEVIPTSTDAVTQTVPLGAYAYPSAAVYDPLAARVLVLSSNLAYFQGYNVTLLATATNRTVGAIGLQNLPIAEAYSPQHGAVYLYDGGTGDVYEINDTTDHVVASGFVGYSPTGVGCPGGVVCQGIAYDPAHDRLFVDAYNYVNWSVAVVNASSLVATPIASGGPGQNASSGIAVDPTDGRAFVGDYDTGHVTVYGTGNLTAEAYLAVGADPLGLAYDPTDDRVFVANSGAGTVSVIDAADDTVLTNVTVGGIPVAAAYDPSDGDVYVANAGSSNNLTAIAAASATVAANISLHATGTPFDVAYDSGADRIEVSLSGTTTFPGELSIVDPSNQSFVGLVPIGTTSVGGGIVYDPGVNESFVTGYTPGTVSVVALGSTPAETYPVTFEETGLPAGTNWSVTLNGTTSSSTGPSIGFAEPNGTYGFAVGSVAGYLPNVTAGSVRVAEVPVSRAIDFTAAGPPTYAADFTETGLASGTGWSVTLNGTVGSSTGPTITFSVPSGTYPFSIGSVAGYTPNLTSGSIEVVGAPVARAIAFTPVPPPQYPVTITESGLPAGVAWSITLAGSTEHGTSGTIVFQEANGTFAFGVGSVAGYAASPRSGNITVNGAGTGTTIVFTASASGGGGARLLGLPGDSGYAVLGGLVGAAVAAALAVILVGRRRRRPRTPGPAGAGGPPSPPAGSG